MFSQRNNPYCELLSDYAMNIDNYFMLVKKKKKKNSELMLWKKKNEKNFDLTINDIEKKLYLYEYTFVKKVEKCGNLRKNGFFELKERIFVISC